MQAFGLQKGPKNSIVSKSRNCCKKGSQKVRLDSLAKPLTNPHCQNHENVAKKAAKTRKIAIFRQFSGPHAGIWLAKRLKRLLSVKIQKLLQKRQPKSKNRQFFRRLPLTSEKLFLCFLKVFSSKLTSSSLFFS